MTAFRDRRDSADDGRGAVYVAVIEKDDTPWEGASYWSSAASAAQGASTDGVYHLDLSTGRLREIEVEAPEEAVVAAAEQLAGAMLQGSEVFTTEQQRDTALDAAQEELSRMAASLEALGDRSAQSEDQEAIVISDDSSDGFALPFYPCTKCDEATVQGGGGTLPCATCRSRQVFYPGGSVALLGLRENSRLNHRQGMAVGSVSREGGNRFGVLLTGETEPVAVRPVNLRPIYTAIFGPPGCRDKPQEHGGGSVQGSANVVVFEAHDVPAGGARYESSSVGAVSGAGEADNSADLCGQENKWF